MKKPLKFCFKSFNLDVCVKGCPNSPTIIRDAYMAFPMSKIANKVYIDGVRVADIKTNEGIEVEELRFGFHHIALTLSKGSFGFWFRGTGILLKGFKYIPETETSRILYG